MHAAVMRAAEHADVVIMAAAVADYTPVNPAAEKMAKTNGPLTLTLERTADILADLGQASARRVTPLVLVGFAAETGDLLTKARDKRARKKADLLVANDVSEPGSGFGTDTNRVVILDRGGTEEALPLLTKREVADRILDRVARALDARDAAAQTATESAAGAQEGRRT
jgi:phosphopantothenoylcysteine decarboxylase/phosphopantothenate--cysteine ligase